jgi:cyclophilin family peptidyl-prolyl cis-trans isomerase
MLQTQEGDIVIEFNEEAAPITVENFLLYVDEGFYDGTVFHRVIPDFMIQGGGLLPDMSKKPTHPPITNEASNGLKNIRGSIAMARTGDPHSATSQFFINHGDNSALNYGSPQSPDGYAVFGKVVKGMEVVDTIATAPTVYRGREKSLPVNPVVLTKAKVISGR